MDEEQACLNQSDEDACGKLWEVYVSQAKEYDESLIKSWKDDMDNTLVFSGLYSAILTAFVIESYHNLQADPAETSTSLLKRISEQLTSPSDVSTLTPFPDESAFTPKTSALICNILWFVSLALALSCAFLATLVQQWSRKFLHRTTMVRSAGARAHLIQFLYFGLKHLGMHTIVDVIPSLLHLSLFAFFAGLIAFLHDVNSILTWLFTAVLFIATSVYSIFTILPIINLSSPYATPLSPILWRIWNISKGARNLILESLRHMSSKFLGLQHPTSTRQVISTSPKLPDLEAQSTTDTSPSPAIQKPVEKERSLVLATMRASRIKHRQQEAASVGWTLRSLSDDVELLPFLEALPDALKNGDALRESNLHLVGPLLETTDPSADVISRMFSLMENALNPWFGEKHRERCATACAKVVLSISRILVEHPRRFTRPALGELQSRRISWFPREMVDQLNNAIENKWFDQSAAATAKTAATLCMLSACQSARNNLPTYDKQAVPASLLEPLLGFAGLSRKGLAKCLGVEAKTPLKFVNHSQAHQSIDLITSELLVDYLQGAMTHYPTEFERVCDLFASNRGDPYKSDYGSMPFDDLCESLDTKSDPGAFRVDYDAIFGVMLSRSSEKEYGWVIRYISKRVRNQGWGATRKLWLNAERLLHCLSILRSSPSLTPYDADSSMTLQEILMCSDAVEDGRVHSLWSSLQEELLPKLGEFPHRSHLSFLIPLNVLIWSEYVDLNPSTFDRILNHSLNEIAYDPQLHADLGAAEHHWAILLHSLNNNLTISGASEVIQLFHSWRSFYDSTTMYELSPRSIGRLVSHTAEFCSLWGANPSLGLLDINVMLWDIWACIIRGLWPESREELDTWSSLFPLLEVSNKLLTPESQDTVRGIISVPSDIQQNTIGSPDFYSDFITTVQTVQKHLLSNLPLFINLPPPDDDEGL